ncbi:MFS transporter [Vagococcus sp. BWB3-3]|uniref:MFS transporter n=1 Tax=Vagococcus allomyrinae TaxID=2794353 RepID=A0A940P556_9ENTE|nr:MFS transporter [Vagococcus allomyrinae]MBP1041749.1 MFS transporter [Vagococcus allomyrinae]
MTKSKYYLTAFSLYFTYFIHGIGVSIIGQYKQDFAGAWGANQIADGTLDVSAVLGVIAALGLGRLISLPFSGPLSDRFGRRVSGLIGVGLYTIYFVGVAFSPSMQIAYAFALIGGAANSFLDTCVTPSVLEIFPENGSVANLFTKFSISIGQFVLPFLIGMVAALGMSFRTLFIVATVLIALDGILIAILPFPEKVSEDLEKGGTNVAKSGKIKFNLLTAAVVMIGFTCTSTFQLWLNCNQELGKMYGLVDPSKIQSFYSAGTFVAILLTAFLINKGLNATKVLIIYPTISFGMLLITYFIQTPTITLVAGFVLGYAAAGGVLQVAVSTAVSMFPDHKGKMTSIVMIASSLANFIILTIAGMITKAGGIDGPKYVLLFNAAITFVGILLAIYVNFKMKKEAEPV